MRSWRRPEGDGPFPTVMSVHGGPEWHEGDRFDAEVLAFVDAGYAVALVNYRGSTGYGVGFREALIGNPCLPESEDVNACLDRLIADGVADPDTRLLERLVLGRLPGVPQRRVAPGSVARDVRRDPGGGLRGGPLGERPGAPGVG